MNGTLTSTTGNGLVLSGPGFLFVAAAGVVVVTCGKCFFTFLLNEKYVLFSHLLSLFFFLLKVLHFYTVKVCVSQFARDFISFVCVCVCRSWQGDLDCWIMFKRWITRFLGRVSFSLWKIFEDF